MKPNQPELLLRTPAAQVAFAFLCASAPSAVRVHGQPPKGRPAAAKAVDAAIDRYMRRPSQAMQESTR